MQTLVGRAISISWIKEKWPLVLQLSNGSGNFSPATLYLIYKALIQPHLIQLLRYSLGKLWHKASGQTPKSVQRRS